MSFGEMPIANGFLTPDDFADEYFFELAPAFCESCSMFQIIDQPAPDKMFHENYAFFSSTSNFMRTHFQLFSDDVQKTHLTNKSNPFVIELGSNDGIMLGNFARLGIRHLGIEPSVNVANVAREAGINTISEFFNFTLSESIRQEYGPADTILAANVMCHIPTINEIASGVEHLLKPDGVLIFEDPYLGAMVEKTSYDQIYDEHVFIFSARSVSNAFSRYNLELIDISAQETHGGSMRYTLARKGAYQPSRTVTSQLNKEAKMGLKSLATYEKFKINCETSKRELIETLMRVRDRGQSVAGYGATSKSTTVINYCDITPDLVSYISDTTPIKQNKFSPGAHIPVKPYEEFQSSPPDYSLLFAWNHKKEIIEKEKSYFGKRGKWINYVPNVEISG